MRGNQINWNQIFYFTEVAKVSSIKIAAEKLNLHPSTLSEHISQLEKDLNLNLFHRFNKRLVLSDQGNRFYQQARPMFEFGQRLTDIISPLSLGCYPVSIGIVANPLIQLSLRTLNKYMDYQKSIGLKVYHTKQDDLEKGLSGGLFDFGLSDKISDKKSITHHLVFSTEFHFYVSPQWKDFNFGELTGKLPLLVCANDQNSESYLNLKLDDNCENFSSFVTSEFPEFLVDLCEEGKGVGIFTEEFVNWHNLKSIRKIHPVQGSPRLSSSLYVLWRNQAENSQAVKLFLDYLNSLNRGDLLSV